jgi:hypothetical protein
VLDEHALGETGIIPGDVVALRPRRGRRFSAHDVHHGLHHGLVSRSQSIEDQLQPPVFVALFTELDVQGINILEAPLAIEPSTAELQWRKSREDGGDVRQTLRSNV